MVASALHASWAVHVVMLLFRTSRLPSAGLWSPHRNIAATAFKHAAAVAGLECVNREREDRMWRTVVVALLRQRKTPNAHTTDKQTSHKQQEIEHMSTCQT